MPLMTRSWWALVLVCIFVADARGQGQIQRGPGLDVFLAEPGSSFIAFGVGGVPPIPPDFFGPGSDPWAGSVSLNGAPVDQISGPDLGGSHVIVERLESFLIAGVGTSAVIDARIAALRLFSVDPITVTFGAGASEEFFVELILDSEVQPTGTMVLNRDCEDGGTFELQTSVSSRVRFLPVGGGAAVELDLGALIGPFVSMVTGSWTHLPLDPALNVLDVGPGAVIDADGDGVPGMPLPGTNADFQTAISLSPCEASTLPGESVQGSETICTQMNVTFQSCWVPTTASGTFVRGDCNTDMSFNIADVIYLLGFSFPGSGMPNVLNCEDACDCNDDGALNITDAICLLAGLFNVPAIPPAPPQGSCGPDPMADALTCASFACP